MFDVIKNIFISKDNFFCIFLDILIKCTIFALAFEKQNRSIR